VTIISPRLLASLDAAIREAVLESRFAYAFSPASYTYGALSACLAAQEAFGVIRSQLSEAADASETEKA
jgi:hypothetical protein